MKIVYKLNVLLLKITGYFINDVDYITHSEHWVGDVARTDGEKDWKIRVVSPRTAPTRSTILKMNSLQENELFLCVMSGRVVTVTLDQVTTQWTTTVMYAFIPSLFTYLFALSMVASYLNFP